MLGGPATGKTTISTRLARSLHIPCFSKDGVKEPMFDDVGMPVAVETDESLSGRKMDNAAISILFYLIEKQLESDSPFVVDCNFRPQHSVTMRSIISRYALTPVQILCQAEGKELANRYRRRAETGERHQGHRDKILAQKFNLDELSYLYQNPLDIGGHVLELDSTNFKEENYQELLKTLRKKVK
mgnify:CR=1 FL=1